MEALKKHRKLVLSQIAAICGVVCLILGWLRYQEVGTWNEQMAGSFLLFALGLFFAEVKLLLDWLRQRKASAH